MSQEIHALQKLLKMNDAGVDVRKKHELIWYEHALKHLNVFYYVYQKNRSGS